MGRSRGVGTIAVVLGVTLGCDTGDVANPGTPELVQARPAASVSAPPAAPPAVEAPPESEGVTRTPGVSQLGAAETSAARMLASTPGARPEPRAARRAGSRG